MSNNESVQQQTRVEAILKVLVTQWPGRIALDRNETAGTCGWKNAITIDRARARGLIHPSVATRKPMYSLPEIARFLVETEGM